MWALLLLTEATAAQVAPSAPPATLQAQFDAAGAALDAGKWAEAQADFEAILARKPLGQRTRSIVLLREGRVLYELRRDDEARRALQEGLAGVAATDPSLFDDRWKALMTSGVLQRASYDYAAARRSFADALALTQAPADRLTALLGLATVTMFDDSAAALAYANEALKLIAKHKVTPEVQAQVRQIHGRVLLIRGDYTQSLAEFQLAVQDAGGLTSHTDLTDVALRSDAALAALKAHQSQTAHEMLMMTGEGRIPRGLFALPARDDVPACGDEVHEDDVAVVEFGIGEDGAVTFANPIYASRQGRTAVSFAKAVSQWSWKAGEAKAIPPFYRALTRIELHCTMAQDRPADIELLKPAYLAWLEAVRAPVPSEDPPLRLPALRAGIAQHQGGAATDQVPFLVGVANSPEAALDEKRAAVTKAVDIAEAAHAPVAALTYLRFGMAVLDRWEHPRSPGPTQAKLRALYARPEVAADAQAGNVMRLIIAGPGGGAGPAEATALLRQVTNDKRLDAHDPLRIGALVRLASLQAQQGDVADAHATYLQTGLSGAQCALVDARPAMKRMGVGSSDYPMDAIWSGISGWTKVEFDVLADGRTANRRVVMAYPPFVFGQPTVKAMEATRYTQTYRPDGASGCSGATQRFRYVANASLGG